MISDLSYKSMNRLKEIAFSPTKRFKKGYAIHEFMRQKTGVEILSLQDIVKYYCYRK
jgi:hypothetical protein